MKSIKLLYCYECNCNKDLQEHHILPKILGGTKTITLCGNCHGKIHGGKFIKLSNLIKKSLHNKRNSGTKYTKSLLGFDVENGKMVVNKKEQKIIRKMFKMYESGSGYTEIANHLNKNGHKIKNGNPFSRSYVRNILQNKQKIVDKPSQFYNRRTPNFI
jgi:hypothetical protein